MPRGTEQLLAQGFVPAGVRPKTIQPDGPPKFEPTGTLAKLARAMETFEEQQIEAAERQQEKFNKQVDMYNTLRDAGYSPKAATKAVETLKFPDELPKDTLSQQKTKADIARTKAETTKLENEANRILKETGEKALSYDRVKARILDKISRDVPLTQGEERVYNEVIRKETSLVAEALAEERRRAKTAEAPLEDTETKVLMRHPDGRLVRVKKSQEKAALTQGYKREQ